MGWLEREVILNNKKGKPAWGIRADLKKNPQFLHSLWRRAKLFTVAINLVDITKLPWDKNP